MATLVWAPVVERLARLERLEQMERMERMERVGRVERAPVELLMPSLAQRTPQRGLHEGCLILLGS